MARKWGDICNLWKVWELSIIALIAAMPSLASAEAVLTSQAYVDSQDALKVDIAQGSGNAGKVLVVGNDGSVTLSSSTISSDLSGKEDVSNKLNGTSTSGQKIGDLTAGSAAGQDQVMYPSAAAVKEYAVAKHPGVGTNNANVGKALIVDSSGDLALGDVDALPPGSANQVIQYNGTNNTWDAVTMDTTPTDSSNKPVTSGGVYDAVNTKQNKIPAGNFTFEDMSLPGLVATTDSAGVTGEVGLIRAWDVIGQDSTDYDNIASAIGIDTTDLAAIDSMATSWGFVEFMLANKQDVLGGDSSTNGKVVTATDNAGSVNYKAIDSNVTDSSENLITSGGVYNALNGKVDVAQGSANAGKGLVVDSGGDLALANILQAINSATNNLTSGDGYVVKAVTLNSDNKTVDVTRDTVKLPVSSGAPSSNTPSGFAEIWVQ